MDELSTLKKANEELEARNAKLYRDCVAFAKKIKENENIEKRLEELETLNENLEALNMKLEADIDELKEELARLSSTEAPSEYQEDENFEEDDEEDYDDIEETEMVEEIIEDEEEEEKFVLGAVNNSPQPEIDPDEAPKNHSKHKKSPFRTFIRTVLWILLILALIIGLASGIAYLFSNSFSDYSVAGYRFATVKNNLMSPVASDDDVILIKYCGLEGIPLDSLVLTTKEKASVATIKSVDVIDGEKLATVEDNDGEYNVNEDQFYGRVVFKIPYLANVVSYACENEYQYLAIVVGANLALIILLVLIPSNKAREPKLGKDYTIDDFTI